MPIYRYKPGTAHRHKVPARIMGPELARVFRRKNGHATNQDIVDSQRSRRAPGRAEFTYDDRQAGIKLRRLEAAALVRDLIKITKAEEMLVDKPLAIHCLPFTQTGGKLDPPVKILFSVAERDPRKMRYLLDRHILNSLRLLRNKADRLFGLRQGAALIDQAIAAYDHEAKLKGW